MDFSLSTEQRELVGEFHDFAARYFTRESVRQWQHDQGLPDEVGKAYAELYYRHKDLSGDNLKGGSLLSQALVNEEVSRVAGTSLPFANETQNLRIMREFAGSSSQLDTAYKTYRESGKLIFSLAVTEPNAGSDTMGHAHDGENRGRQARAQRPQDLRRQRRVRALRHGRGN
jgi:alkylation response protein AidB-like acyl-CoA dehydrogenase